MLTNQQQAALYFARKRHRIANSLAVSAEPVTTAAVSTAYGGFTVSASGGQSPYVYSVWGGALPDGLALDAATGAVSGTPTQAGAYTATIAVTDAYGNIRLLPAFTITVS